MLNQQIVNWHCSGKEIRNFFNPSTGKLLSRPQNIEYFYRPGITWPLRARRFSPQALAEGCVFSARGYAAFVDDGDELATMAVFSSSVFDYLFKVCLGRAGFPEYIVGVISKLPWAEPSGSSKPA